ncbi:uncharacterized protein PV09_05401 [Verruconis gallopava]|uniref:Uncharacterized protein n=1 Tax=Verruconis gallopava TaxID=253628 RepID=A0A0D2AVK3_9PEZI|nr:uncharacterized protein PV09_05401 [Verruconis gallopava]KIW03174.1 hypothetical protein PV09_05401 [Verruconis gallopava]
MYVCFTIEQSGFRATPFFSLGLRRCHYWCLFVFTVVFRLMELDLSFVGCLGLHERILGFIWFTNWSHRENPSFDLISAANTSTCQRLDGLHDAMSASRSAKHRPLFP